MGKENGRGKSRRRNISQARKFLNREGKKLCSAALCVSLLFGSVLNTTVAANKDTDDDEYEFELSRASLYQALQDAVLNGDTVDEDMEFRGSAAEEYSEMFAPSGSLYELKPEIEDNDGKVQLRVFAKLDQDIDLDSEYEAAGTEEIMFLLTNRSDEAQKAVIYMDDKYTEEIEVAPGKAIAVQEDETSQGPAGGGSSSGGSAAGGENPADTETTGPADEGGQAPDNGGAPTESQPEETTGTEDKDDATTPDGATDPAEGDDNVTDGNEETGDSADDKTDDSATSDNDNSTSVEDGDNENSGNGGDTENTGDPNTGSDNAGSENQSGGQTGAGEGGSENTGNTENGGGSADDSDGGNSATGGGSGSSDTENSSSDSNDSGNDGSDSGTTTAAISFHRASWVAAPVATDSNMPVATGSELATNSDLEKLIDGELYEAVRLRENGAVAFVTTLDDLGVMDGWGPIVFGQKFEADIDGFRVRAIARKGVLPDDVQLEVEELREDDAQTADGFQEAKAALDATMVEEGSQYDGMMALDIKFVDENGDEIEPNGDVQVSIEVKEGKLPEDVDLETVKVHHLKEVGTDAVKVEAVADGAGETSGTVKSADEVVAELKDAQVPEEEIPAAVSSEASAVAAFSVESFSYFTITWNMNFDKKTITVHVIDENGADVPGGHLSKYDISEYGSVSVDEESSNIPYIQNYKYQYAVVASDANSAVGNTAIKISALRLTPAIGEYKVQYSTGGLFGWSDLGQKNVYLVYSKDTSGSSGGSGGDPVIKLPTPEISKTAISNKDGTYSLNLSVTGRAGSETSTVNVDVLMIADESNSMTNTRINNTKRAMKTLIDSLQSQNGVSARYNICTFGKNATSETNGWLSMPQNYVPRPEEGVSGSNGFTQTPIGTVVKDNIAKRDEGTNYEAALKKAIEELQNVRDNAITVVVFLSDGQPSMSANWGNGYNVMSGNNFWAWRETLETADGIYCNQFYTVGISTEMEKFLSENDEGYGGLLNAVNAQKKQYISTDSSGTGLSGIFSDIAGAALELFIDHVRIEDFLNLTYVEPVSQNGNVQLDIKVVDETNTDVTEKEKEEGEITAAYTAATGKLELLFGDETYQLKPNYTYTLTMQIQPNENAHQYYAEHGYPHRPSANGYTGTHTYETGDMGFYSNTVAKLHYQYTNNSSADGQGPKEMEYLLPVVQLTVGNLVIEKKVEGLTGDNTALQQLQNNLKFEVVKNGETTPVETIFYKDFVNGKYTVSGLVPGKYTVRESGSTISGYECTATTSPTTPEVTVTKGGTANITFTNRYTKLYSLTVKKLLDGDMVETDKEFEFTATVDGDPYTTGEGFDQDGHFFLAGNEQISLTGLLAGSQVIIEEIGYNGYRTSIDVEDGGTANTHTPIIGTSSNRKYDTGTNGLTADTTVVFTNHKSSTTDVPLTGIFTDKLPYLLMFSIAMICTAGAMFNSSVRRRHGREEE